MAPMVDMVFLLLVFFMCVTGASSQRVRMKVDLPQTVAATAADTAQAGSELRAVAPQVVLSLAPDGLLAVNGVTRARSELLPLLQTLQRDAGATRAGKAETGVRIRAYADAPYSEIAVLLEACAAAGISRISYAAYEADLGTASAAAGAGVIGSRLKEEGVQ